MSQVTDERNRPRGCTGHIRLVPEQSRDYRKRCLGATPSKTAPVSRGSDDQARRCSVPKSQTRGVTAPKRVAGMTLCCLTALICCGADLAESFDTVWQVGMQKMQAKEWGEARNAFVQALGYTKEHGQKADSELHIGRCLQAEGNNRDAMKAWVNAMRRRYYSAANMRGTAWPGARDEYARILDVPVTQETAETVIFKALAEIGIAQQWQKHDAPARAEKHYHRALKWLHAPQVTNRALQQRDLRTTYLGLSEVHAARLNWAAAQDTLRLYLDVPGEHQARGDMQHRLWTLCRLTNGYDAMRDRIHARIATPDTLPADRVIGQCQIAYSFIYERRYEDAGREFSKLLTMEGATPRQRSEAQLYIAHTRFVARQYADARLLYQRVVDMEQAAPACVTTARSRIKAIDTLANEHK